METRCLPFDIRSLDTLEKMLDILKVPAVIATPEAYKHLFDLAQKSDEIAQQAGHVDLFIKQADGWHGHNLIWKTALRALENKLGRKSSEDRPLDRRNALILGCGGLGKSVAAGIKKRNGMVSIAPGTKTPRKRPPRNWNCATCRPRRSMKRWWMWSCSRSAALIMEETHAHQCVAVAAGMTVMDLNELPNGSHFTFEAKERGCKVWNPARCSRNISRRCSNRSPGKISPRKPPP